MPAQQESCSRLGQCEGSRSKIRQDWQIHKEAVWIWDSNNMNRDQTREANDLAMSRLSYLLL